MPAGDIKIISNIHLPRVGTPTPSLSGLQSTSMSVKSSSPNLSVRRSPISTPPPPSSDGNPCLPPINSQLSSESQADVPHIPVQRRSTRQKKVVGTLQEDNSDVLEDNEGNASNPENNERDYPVHADEPSGDTRPEKC